jgi:hypothetical protein
MADLKTLVVIIERLEAMTEVTQEKMEAIPEAMQAIQKDRRQSRKDLDHDEGSLGINESWPRRNDGHSEGQARKDGGTINSVQSRLEETTKNLEDVPASVN